MYFWRENRVSRRVFSSRRLNLSMISAASIIGELTSLQAESYKSERKVSGCWSWNILEGSFRHNLLSQVVVRYELVGIISEGIQGGRFLNFEIYTKLTDNVVHFLIGDITWACVK